MHAGELPVECFDEACPAREVDKGCVCCGDSSDDGTHDVGKDSSKDESESHTVSRGAREGGSYCQYACMLHAHVGVGMGGLQGDAMACVAGSFLSSVFLKHGRHKCPANALSFCCSKCLTLG
jgi:hypothetical protein